MSREGHPTSLGVEPEVFQSPRLSPDGGHLAVVVRSGMMTREIRVLAVSQRPRTVLTVTGGDNQSPAWMDSRRLSFGSNRDGPQRIYTVSVGRTAVPAPMFTANVAAARNPASWSRPPRLLALYEIDPQRKRDVLVYRVGESIAPMAATSANERSPSVSFDGRWMAYVSDASGRDQVYIKALDGPSAEEWPVTRLGASEPAWAREGLFYREGERMMLAPFVKGRPGVPQSLFEGHFERDPGANTAAYDVAADGRFFIMLKSASSPRELRIVRNWGTELTAVLGSEF